MFVSIFLWSVLTLLRIFCLLHVVETACRHRWGCTWIESRNPEFSVGMNLASLFRNETGIDCWIKSQVWALNSPVVVKRGMSFEAKLLIQAAERTLAFKRLQPSRFLSSEPPSFLLWVSWNDHCSSGSVSKQENCPDWVWPVYPITAHSWLPVIPDLWHNFRGGAPAFVK